MNVFCSLKAFFLFFDCVFSRSFIDAKLDNWGASGNSWVKYDKCSAWSGYRKSKYHHIIFCATTTITRYPGFDLSADKLFTEKIQRAPATQKLVCKLARKIAVCIVLQAWASDWDRWKQTATQWQLTSLVGRIFTQTKTLPRERNSVRAMQRPFRKATGLKKHLALQLWSSMI